MPEPGLAAFSAGAAVRAADVEAVNGMAKVATIGIGAVDPGDPQAERSLGDRLVAAGALTSDQLDEALDVQQALARLGEPLSLHHVLVALRYVPDAPAATTMAPRWATQQTSRPLPYDAALVTRLAGWLERLGRLIP